MSNNKPYMDPSMFTQPPPNFKNNQTQWNSFKIPIPPVKYSDDNKSPTRYPKSSERTSRKYSNASTMPSIANRNYKNESPPTYTSQKTESPSTSLNNYKNDLLYNSVGLMQSFKPDVPPPSFNKTAQYTTDVKPNAASPGITQSQDGKKAYYYDPVLYRYYNGACPTPFLQSQIPYISNSTESYSVPPPSNYYQHSQPPLPNVPPPQKPPPPPPPPSAPQSPGNSSGVSSMFMQNHSMMKQNHHMTNYNSRMSSYGSYANPYQQNYKRKYEGTGTHRKVQKKKKKPLSQVVPQRRDWTLEEANKALNAEKESNKRSKRQGLIIKFPDLELNRDIVSNFHTSIESVHFQQPSTPRYCFVTLGESADPDTVIKQLNQIPFGLGHLCAEYKKDREDEQNVRATDIDPLTLYVGNLAQEITKEDMTKTYPKQKRIDIGYAKKMKYTRYAFVSFYTVDDAIEAFQRTHSSQMHSKSLIVRFRRLHGTVGMPGEPKQTTKTPSEGDSNSTVQEEIPNPWDIDISHWESDYPEFKQQSEDEDYYDETDVKTLNCKTRSTTASVPLAEPINHRPIMIGMVKIDEVERADSPIHFRSLAETDIEIKTEAEQFQEVLDNIKQEKPFVIDAKEENDSDDDLTDASLEKIAENAISIKKEKLDEKSGEEMGNETRTSDSNIEPQGNEQRKSVAQAESTTQPLTNNDDKDPEGSEYGGGNFSWMDMDYSAHEIKTESDDHDGDDDSSDDELSIDNILKRTRNRCK